MGSLSRQEEDPTNFLRLAYHASITLNKTIFIDGGDMVVQAPDGSIFMGTNNNTLVLDVSRSWSDGTQAVFSSVTKDDAANLNVGHLWAAADNNSFYQFGGLVSGAPFVSRPISSHSFNLFRPAGFSPVNGTWSAVPISGDSTYVSLDRPAGGLSASGGGKGFLLGGFVDDDARKHWPVPGLLTYDMATNEWTNQTAQGFSPPSTALLGTMQFLPGFGTEGILIAFGGQTADPSKFWWNDGENMLDMGDIHIYDIAHKQWHHQTAVGATPDAIPAVRDLFCSAVLSSNGPHSTVQSEIFVYGGENGDFAYSYRGATAKQKAASAALNVVHVLTIPGFTWFRTNDESAPPRTRHTCEVAGQRQVLSIGGLDPTYGEINASTVVDSFPHGIGVFDMSTWKWKQNYDATAATYEPADAVQTWYRQNHAVKWSDNSTAALFSRNAPVTEATSSPPPTGPSISTGATVGAAIGGTFGLLILVLSLVLCLRQQRKPSQRLIVKTLGAKLHGEASQETELPGEAQVKAELRDINDSTPELMELASEAQHELPGNGMSTSSNAKSRRA